MDVHLKRDRSLHLPTRVAFRVQDMERTAVPPPDDNRYRILEGLGRIDGDSGVPGWKAGNSA